MSNEFTEAKKRSGNSLCPLSNMSMCRGYYCVLWLNTYDNKLENVAKNCLYRLSLLYSYKKRSKLLDPFNFKEFAEKNKN